MKMRYVVGIDADGTIFDTMNIKHREVFWQCMMKKWNLTDEDGKILALGEKINLYSKSRGVNRFPGLLSVMEGTPALDSLDKSALKAFINSGSPLSNAGLKKYIESHGNEKILADALEWSMDVDRVFAEKTEGLLPFAGADRAIRMISKYADVVIVSSASGAILERDLAHAGLASHITRIMGQECGKKHEQINAIRESLSPDRVLMIGDAISDCEAAYKAGAYFFPILPGREEESWYSFSNRYFDAFLKDSYHECDEARLYQEFLDVFID